MDTVFLTILNMSISASWLVLAVLLLRPLLRKAPKALSVLLWGLVGIRLVCPHSPESIFSLIPSAQTIPTDIVYSATPEIESGIYFVNSTINPIIAETLSPSPVNSANPLQVITFAASVLWLAGIVVMLAYSLISSFRIRRKLREAAFLHDHVWVCDQVASPFIFGVIRPRIYLPSSMSETDIAYVLAHENAHLKRRDHLWKPLGFLLLTVYWFNPLLWVAYILLCRDIELACDEKVIRDMGAEIKKPYSNALINCSVPRRMIAACPLAFGEVGVKGRVKSVLNYKKPAFWIMIAAVIVCFVVALCFLTNPSTIPDDDSNVFIDDELSVFIDRQIADHHQAHDSRQYACCIDRKVLGTEHSGDTTTFYMWVLYEEYSKTDDRLHVKGGAHTPTAITVKKENGNYSLVEYWTPRDGSYYVDDIRDKFPMLLWGKAVDSQRYIDEQKENCEKQAQEYFDSLSSDSTPTQTVKTISELRSAYPEYFDLNAADGLSVYVWQMAANHYSCGLLPGKYLGQNHTMSDLWHLQGTTIEEMKLILSTYDVGPEHIAVIPSKNPISSYFYQVDDNYRAMLRKKFFGDNDVQLESFDDWGLSTEITFHDSARFDLVLKHDSRGMTAEGTLTTSPEYELRAVYNGAILPYSEYMRSVLGFDYSEPELSWDTVLYTIEPDSELVIEGNLLVTYGTIPPGEYIICKPVQLTTDSGKVFTRLYTAEFAVVE